MMRVDHGTPRRVAVVTGTRAEYGLLRSVLHAIETHPALELQLVATGMHLLGAFGRTVDDIERDGWKIDARVPMQTGDDHPLDQAEGLSRGIAGMARLFEQADTHIVVVLGDRIEAMAAALAAVTTGRILAHIHGGDVAPGDFDEGFRHAITKMAHVHLAATEAACARIRRMGEDATRIHWVGAPGLDAIIHAASRREPTRAPSGQALVIYHPCGREAAQEARVMDAILRAVDDSRLTPMVIYPNTDRGHTGVVTAIEAFAARVPRTCVVRSMPHEDYVAALLDADLLVGNSSSGIIEAPAAGTPSVNVGDRQAGRERGGPSVIDADESYECIKLAIAQALPARPITSGDTIYGDGQAGIRIAEILAEVPLDYAFRRKIGDFDAAAARTPPLLIH